MKPEQGDLVLVPFPMTDLTGMKRRPAVVVSPNAVNRASEDRIVVAVTSQLGSRPPGGYLGLVDSDLSRGSLLKPSLVLPAKIFSIHRSLIVKTVGRLKPAVLERVLARLRDLFRAP